MYKHANSDKANEFIFQKDKMPKFRQDVHDNIDNWEALK